LSQPPQGRKRVDWVEMFVARVDETVADLLVRCDTFIGAVRRRSEVANDIVPWVYTDNKGRGYITGINSEVAAQETGDPLEPIIGGNAPSGAELEYPPLPSSVKPRRAYMKNPAGKGRTVTIMSKTAPLTDDDPPTLSLEDSDGAATVYTVRKLLPEDFGRSRV
jgi:hypothetical protein